MNQKPFRALFLWVIWASTALIVYVSLYRDTEVWDFLGHDPSRITWLIMGLFVLGIIGSFALTILLTFESLAALHFEEIIRDKGLTGFRITSHKRAVERFFDALKTTLDVHGQPDIEALLNVELSVYQRISHSVEVIGNLLITLGLIGTVMGLTLTLTGLTSSLDALGHDQELLLSGLRKAMAGMGTAFYTTLLGAVLGGVLLRVFAQITQHGVEGLFDSLMRICMVYCSADFRPSLERDLRFLNAEIKSLGSHLDNLQGVLNHSGSAMSDFRDEVNRLHELSRRENEFLTENLRTHNAYCEMLRQESHLIRKVSKPWWTRLKEALGL